MTDAQSAITIVKTGAVSALVWVPVIQTLAGGMIAAVAASAAVILTHRLTLKREKLAALDKRDQEFHYLASELIFALERYALAWVALSWTPLQQFSKGVEQSARLNLSLIKGDWRSLPVHESFRLRSLETDHAGLISFLKNEHFIWSQLNATTLRISGLNIALKAFLLAGRLRRLAGLADSSHLKSETGVFRMLREGRRISRHQQQIIKKHSGTNAGLSEPAAYPAGSNNTASNSNKGPQS
ncbi:hypothetical protein [Pantoea vagans]|uniref:hypothetical protein n=1 Tax=Pantoea vagans TaxID=470934 RepID=UPI000D784D1B|nr:hypothetical protein [Pantoea vagans]AWP35225.1 hypothetical protein B9D02_21805 [Pantoea vagans]